MKLIPTLVAGTIALALGAQSTLCGQDKDDVAEYERLRRDAVVAKDVGEAGRALKTLFGKPNEQVLRRLQKDPDTGIALQAAWELAFKPPSGSAPRPHRFFGFLEGRIGVEIPLRWEVKATGILLGDRADLRRAAFDDYVPAAPFLHRMEGGWFSYQPEEYRKTDLGLRAPIGTVIKVEGDTVHITVGQHTVRASGELFQRLPKESFLRHVSTHIGAERSVVALHGYDGIKFPLVCLDSRSGKFLWQAESWGYGGNNVIGLRSGYWRHDVAIALTEKLVVLFHHGGGPALEAFDLRTGNPAFRFSSDYWMTGRDASPQKAR